MNIVKAAVIGIGSIAESVHLKYLQKNEHVLVKALVDMDLERAKSVARNHHIPHVFASIDELVKEVHVDAVLICTPNATHIPIAKKAAEQHIHVFIEKPIGTNLNEVKEYLTLAAKKNIRTMVGMTHRYRRDVSIIRKYIDQGMLGNLYYAKAKLFRRRGTPRGWFTNQDLSGGGALMDIGIHVLDLAWWLMGKQEIHSISGQTLTKLGNYRTKYVSAWSSTNKKLNANHTMDVDDFASAYIRLKNDAVIHLEIAWAINGEQDNGVQVELFGDKGGAKLSPLTIYKEENGVCTETTPTYEDAEAFEIEINHFIECVKTGEEPLSNGKQGYQLLEMIMGIYESSKQKKEVKF
ncbi:Gfo/Idh/MocA family protein [Virgibacillus halodenitrificans]|uniref:Gfo/Idh/MocA family protein n=1 Tax=Virgibacillus halodenitrificans TaxID=1482 RepID=UPI0002D927B7|nr:Gfo/Idh/MocA family oxidoreductase [Virgibacillus halodenitrificans]MYL55944.1 gfo/Idh/MocA family oxidoreductase [Virgibacillus halodenitrificans]